MNIINTPTASKEQILKWVETKKTNKLAIDLIDTFYDIAVKHGINPIIVYCQSMKETSYMNFGGVLDNSFKNPCGLKISKGGGNDDPNAHMRFNSWTEGITAQCEHLALYAGAKGYPLAKPIDPRHFPYLLGKCPTVEDLSDNWAGGNYGLEIIRMCEEVQKIVIIKDDIVVNLKKEIEQLKKEVNDLKDKLNSANEKINMVKDLLF